MIQSEINLFNFQIPAAHFIESPHVTASISYFYSSVVYKKCFRKSYQHHLPTVDWCVLTFLELLNIFRFIHHNKNIAVHEEWSNIWFSNWNSDPLNLTGETATSNKWNSFEIWILENHLSNLISRCHHVRPFNSICCFHDKIIKF